MLLKTSEIFSGPRGLTPEHMVLTSTGCAIAKITKKHAIATLNKKEEIVYERPKKVLSFDYDGEIYCVKEEGVDLRVTLNHKMYVNTTRFRSIDKEYNLVESRFLIGKELVTKKTDFGWEKKAFLLYLLYLAFLVQEVN